MVAGCSIITMPPPSPKNLQFWLPVISFCSKNIPETQKSKRDLLTFWKFNKNLNTRYKTFWKNGFKVLPAMIELQGQDTLPHTIINFPLQLLFKTLSLPPFFTIWELFIEPHTQKMKWTEKNELHYDSYSIMPYHDTNDDSTQPHDSSFSVYTYRLWWTQSYLMVN